MKLRIVEVTETNSFSNQKTITYEVQTKTQRGWEILCEEEDEYMDFEYVFSTYKRAQEALNGFLEENSSVSREEVVLYNYPEK